jgi:hypothetical protein
MWVLWWTKRHWGRFSPSTSVSSANHSTNFSIIIITRGWHNRPVGGCSAEWTQLDSPPTIPIKKKTCFFEHFLIILSHLVLAGGYLNFINFLVFILLSVDFRKSAFRNVCDKQNNEPQKLTFLDKVCPEIFKIISTRTSRSRNSAVGTATGYTLDVRGSEFKSG